MNQLVSAPPEVAEDVRAVGEDGVVRIGMGINIGACTRSLNYIEV